MFLQIETALVDNAVLKFNRGPISINIVFLLDEFNERNRDDSRFNFTLKSGVKIHSIFESSSDES